MRFRRRVASFDTETTGPDPVNDRIVEFGVVVMDVDGSTCGRWVKRFNPGIQISPGATEKHGITDEDVAGEPPFSSEAYSILQGLSGKDLLGFNLFAFDIPILDEEMRRCGLKLNLDGVLIYDAFAIFQIKNPRDLSAAVAHYCGRDHAGAHGAMADSSATVDVLIGQLVAHEDLAGMTPEELAQFCDRSEEGQQRADFSGKLYRDSDGDLRYRIGNAKDQKVRDNPGFGRWMLDKDFPGNTKDVLRAELTRHCGW